MGGNRNFGRDSVARDDNGTGYNNRNSDNRDFSSVDRGNDEF